MPARTRHAPSTHFPERDLIVLISRKSGLVDDGKTRSKHKGISGKKAVIPSGICCCFRKIANDIDYTAMKRKLTQQRRVRSHSQSGPEPPMPASN